MPATIPPHPPYDIHSNYGVFIKSVSNLRVWASINFSAIKQIIRRAENMKTFWGMHRPQVSGDTLCTMLSSRTHGYGDHSHCIYRDNILLRPPSGVPAPPIRAILAGMDRKAKLESKMLQQFATVWLGREHKAAIESGTIEEILALAAEPEFSQDDLIDMFEWSVCKYNGVDYRRGRIIPERSKEDQEREVKFMISRAEGEHSFVHITEWNAFMRNKEEVAKAATTLVQEPAKEPVKKNEQPELSVPVEPSMNEKIERILETLRESSLTLPSSPAVPASYNITSS